jgi:hypothetical protein
MNRIEWTFGSDMTELRDSAAVRLLSYLETVGIGKQRRPKQQLLPIPFSFFAFQQYHFACCGGDLFDPSIPLFANLRSFTVVPPFLLLVDRPIPFHFLLARDPSYPNSSCQRNVIEHNHLRLHWHTTFHSG